MTRRRVIYLVAGSGILIGAVWLGFNYRAVFSLVKAPWFNQHALVHYMRSRGPWAMLPLIILLATVSVIPGAPNSVVAVVSGICLGAPLGFVTNLLGLSIGNTLGAALIDHLPHSQRASQKRLVEELTHLTHPRLRVVIAYAIPFIPNTLTHIAAARVGIKGRELVPLIVLGALPTAFFYAFGGDAVLKLNWPQLLIAVVAIGASVGLIGLIRQHHEKQN